MAPKKSDRNSGVAPANEIELPKESIVDKFKRAFTVTRASSHLQLVKPIFLHRTLSYQKLRMSRNHRRRATFTMADLNVDPKKEKQYQYMTLIFLGYYDDSRPAPSSGCVKVETFVAKTCQDRRKDITSPLVKLSIGGSEVPVNPADDAKVMSPIISVPPEMITPSNGSTVKSYAITMAVTFDATRDENGGSGRDGSRTVLEGTLGVYNKKGECILNDAIYELKLKQVEKSSKSQRPQPVWTSTDKIDEKTSINLLVDGPCVKFMLQWTNEPKSGWVDRPKIVKTENGDNKENRPARKAQSSSNKCNHSSVQKESTSGSRRGSTTARGSPITLQFFFKSGKEFMMTDHVTNSDYTCPFCGLKCLVTYALLKHLRNCHPRLHFSYFPSESLPHRVEIAVNETYDSSFAGNPDDLLRQPNTNGKDKGPRRRKVATEILVWPPKKRKMNKLIKQSMDEFTENDDADIELHRRHITGHPRVYYHMMTLLPVLPDEMDADSEEERDPKWLQEKTVRLIDEFNDVNDGEKQIVKLWNLHVLKHGFVGDCQMEVAVSMFIQERALEVFQKNLYRNFHLHLCDLVEHGLLSSFDFYRFIKQLQEIMREKPKETLEVCYKSLDAQKKHWLATGGLEGPLNKMGKRSSEPTPSTSSPFNFSTLENNTRRQKGQKKTTNADCQRFKPSKPVEELPPKKTRKTSLDEMTDTGKRKMSLNEKERSVKRKRCASQDNGSPSASSETMKRRSSDLPELRPKQTARKSAAP